MTGQRQWRTKAFCLVNGWMRPLGQTTLPLEVIAEAGHGGIFLEFRHTFESMRTTTVMPRVATRRIRVGRFRL
jgi:trimethylamine:corrinoid methyltransferase-like protein